MGKKIAYETPAVETTEDTKSDFEALLDGPMGAALSRIDTITGNADLAEIVHKKGKAGIIDACRIAAAMKGLEELMSPELMTLIRYLAGNIIGFRTDRDHTDRPYADQDIKRCVIIALLSGYRLFGNEWNIIGGNFYGAKNGLQRLCNEVPGVRGVHCVVAGEPVLKTGKGRVEIVVRWDEGAEARSMEFTGDKAINVRLNQGMAGDGAIGKATRKALNVWYQSKTGRNITPTDEPSVVESVPDDVQAAINGDKWVQTFDKDGLPTEPQRSKVDEL